MLSALTLVVWPILGHVMALLLHLSITCMMTASMMGWVHCSECCDTEKSVQLVHFGKPQNTRLFILLFVRSFGGVVRNFG